MVAALKGPRILRSIGLVTRSGSVDEAVPRIACLLRAVALDVFSAVLVLGPFVGRPR